MTNRVGSNAWPTVLALLAILIIAGSAGFSGLIREADQRLADLRFETRHQTASGQYVFLALDTRSLEKTGVWPWPRSLYATITDRVLGAGANELIFDIDFSSQSTGTEDAAFARALEDAGGYALLAAFNQVQNDGTTTTNLPVSRFLQHADPVAVNVATDGAGIARLVPLAIAGENGVIPSLAGRISRQPNESGYIALDYGIDASTIDVISASDVLDGTMDSSRFDGKTVVFGSSALELQDFFYTPNQGVLPGATIQILSAETVLASRALNPSGPAPALVVLALVLASFGIAGAKSKLKQVLLAAFGVAIAAEITALAAYHIMAMVLSTVPLHLGLIAYAIWRVLSETRVRQFLVDRLRGERNTMRDILDRVVADNFDGVVIVDGERRILAVSALASEWLGADIVGRQAEAILPDRFIADIQRVFDETPETMRNASMSREAAIVMPGGTFVIEYVVTLSRVLGTDGRTLVDTFACLTFRDVTARRAYEDRLHYLAEHDELTGALGRAHFTKLADAKIAKVTQGECAAVLVFNLRRFKSINGTLGHQAGDEMLRQVVARLKAAGYDTISRLGADSFALLIHGDAVTTTARDKFVAVSSTLMRPFDLDGHTGTVGLAAGWAETSSRNIDAETLVRQADMALALAKQGPGDQIVTYSDDLDAGVHLRRTLETELRSALERGQFEIAYQPQVNLAAQAVSGAEALLRWRHPERGYISPLSFLSVAEETGLIADIGRHVLRKACRDALEWPTDLTVAVNVSPLQFELSNFYEEVVGALEATGLPPERLEIEITESVLLQHRDAAVQTLHALSALGVRIAIDDFGTGFSSLAYLSQLPFDVLKIDKSFVDAMFESDAAMRIVETIIQLGNQLDKTVLAEGVETLEQANTLETIGCEMVQGYYFGKPAPTTALVVLADRMAGRNDDSANSQSALRATA